MQTFKLEIFDRIPIINSGNDVIFIDTGAPLTIHTRDRITFLGKEHQVATEFFGITIQSISSQLGREITTLLGADILKDYYVVYDYKNQSVSLSNEPFEFDGEDIALKTSMMGSHIRIDINGTECITIVDTGAKISYVDSRMTKGMDHIDEREDFHPLLGKFITKIYLLEVTIGGHRLQMPFGNLPEPLETMTMMTGAKCVIGYSLFEKFKVLMNIGKEVMKIKMYEG